MFTNVKFRHKKTGKVATSFLLTDIANWEKLDDYKKRKEVDDISIALNSRFNQR